MNDIQQKIHFISKFVADNIVKKVVNATNKNSSGRGWEYAAAEAGLSQSELMTEHQNAQLRLIIPEIAKLPEPIIEALNDALEDLVG